MKRERKGSRQKICFVEADVWWTYNANLVNFGPSGTFGRPDEMNLSRGASKGLTFQALRGLVLNICKVILLYVKLLLHHQLSITSLFCYKLLSCLEFIYD